MIKHVNLELRAVLHHVSNNKEAQFGLYAVPAENEPRLIGAVQVFFQWDPVRGENLRCLPTEGMDQWSSSFLDGDQLEAIDFEQELGRAMWVRRSRDNTIAQPGGTLIQTFGIMVRQVGNFKLGTPRTQVCRSTGEQVLGTAIFSPFAPALNISKALLAGRCDVKATVTGAAAATEAAAAEKLAADSQVDESDAGDDGPDATATESDDTAAEDTDAAHTESDDRTDEGEAAVGAGA